MTNHSNVTALPLSAAQKARMDRDAKRRDMRILAQELAAAIGWHVWPDDERSADAPQLLTERACATMAERHTVPTLVISQRWQKDARIEIRACWPHGEGSIGMMSPGGTDDKQEITVAHHALGARVASEIQRRLLPQYLALHALQVAKIRSWEQHKADGEALAERIADACGVRRQDSQGAQRLDFYVDEGGAAGAHVQVSGETVRIEATGLTEAQAIAILKIVREG